MQEGGGGEAAIQSAIQRAQERALAADVAATRAEQRNLPEADRVDPATAAANANAAVAAMLQEEADAESGGDEDQVGAACRKLMRSVPLAVWAHCKACKHCKILSMRMKRFLLGAWSL